MTRLEVVVIICSLVILAVMFLSALAAAKKISGGINCINKIKQIGLAYRMWEGDHGDKFPSSVSVTNGGILEMADRGSQAVVLNFQAMSNEVSVPRNLICPQDIYCIAAPDFASLTESNISYFINLDASDASPQMILSGDDNLLFNGTPVPSGILELHTNDVVTWSKYRHIGTGNVGLADGSAQQIAGPDCTSAFLSAGAATNRIIIP